MATIKKTDEAENVNASKEELVTIKLPLTKEDKSDVFASVNERTWLIKRGVAVDVPKCVAEVLEHSEQAALARWEFENAMQK